MNINDFLCFISPELNAFGKSNTIGNKKYEAARLNKLTEKPKQTVNNNKIEFVISMECSLKSFLPAKYIR